jgi:CPA2 family monovalent cation:H+ antiporter-2
MIKFSPDFYNLLLRILPSGWISALNFYSSSTQNLQAESSWKKVLKGYVSIIITNGIIIMALTLLSLELVLPFLNEHVSNAFTRNIITLVLSFGLTTPFIWALMAKRPNNMDYKELWLDKKYNHGPLLALELTRIIIGLLIIGFLLDRIFSTFVAILIVFPVVIIVLILFSKRIQQLYQRLEGRFLSNLNARETADAEISGSKNVLQEYFNVKSGISLWDAHIFDIEITQQNEFIGKTLVELAWREQFGINIAYIKRGEKLIFAPEKCTRIFPFDHVGIIGTDEQIQSFKPIFNANENPDPTEHNIEEMEVQKIVVNQHFKFRGLTIRNSKIRERVNGLVIGIERNKERILNPGSDTLIEWGDIVWIFGDREKIRKLYDEGDIK